MTSTNDKGTINGLKGMLSYYVFVDELEGGSCKEYTKPLYIPPGEDSLVNIGEPKVNYVEVE
jgi:hypothetical protein